MDRFFASRVSSSSNAAQSARQLSSFDDVRRWLTTLTEVTSTQKLESLRAAVNVRKKPEPKRDDVRPLCKTWSVQQDRGNQRWWEEEQYFRRNAPHRGFRGPIKISHLAVSPLQHIELC